MREVEVAMSRGPDESGGFDGTEDPYDALLDPDEEADMSLIRDAGLSAMPPRTTSSV